MSGARRHASARQRTLEPRSIAKGKRRSARTHAPALRACVQIAPDRPSVAGTPADKQFGNGASDTSKIKLQGCPPNRVNSRLGFGRGGRRGRNERRAQRRRSIGRGRRNRCGSRRSRRRYANRQGAQICRSSNCRNAPMITPLKSVNRCAVDERDGRLYVAGAQITISAEREAWRAMDDMRCSFGLSGVTLDDSTLDRIDDALTAEAASAGSNMPVGLDPSARLHRCVGCGAPFIAHPAARLCSPECRTAFKRASQRKASSKRTIRRGERRAALRVRCRQCGEPVERASRRQRAFCSNACRQAAYRARADLRRPTRMGRV
jgi:hypothetical protein